MAERTQAPILISGGGLVGLSTAMFLARHGVPSLVVERMRETSTLPRAAFFHMRTLELFREAGIEPQVRAQSEREFTPDGAVVAVESLAGREIAAFIPSLNEGVGELSPCRRLFITQPGLEPILRRRAEEGGARVLTGHEVVSATQDDAGIVARVRDLDTAEEREIEARYLVCAEGGRSTLRDAAGIAMDGRGIFSRSLTIYFKADLSPFLDGRNFSLIYVVNPTLSGFFRLDKNHRRGFLAVNIVGDPVADPERAANAAADASEPRLRALFRAAVGADVAMEIEGVARWRCTADLAQRYRDGRMFLAGDSAHLMPPTGGFGGNTGVHDAHNLAWKLALVVNGVASPALLDTYAAERRPAGRFTVEQAYTRYVTRSARYLGARDFEPLADDFEIELGCLYRSNAVLAEPGAPEGHEDPHASRGRAGSRAPHLWLESAEGRLSTLDLFGRGFVLLAGPEGGVWKRAVESVRPPGLALECRVADGRDLRDPAGALAAAFGIGPAGASLVRPDGYVAWRAPEPDPGALPHVLATLLAA